MSSNLLYYILIPVGTVSALYIIRKLREWQWGWVRATYSLKERVYIITGANTGLGFETTKALVKRQATVIMACRSLERANDAIGQIRLETNEGNMIPLLLDLASFESIEAFAEKIKSSYSTFNCLINNAGMAMRDQSQTTKEGFELHVGVNHLGHFYLTDLLKDIIKSNSSRIVVVSSRMHEKGAVIDFESLGKPREASGVGSSAYNDSKLMNFYFARELYKKGHDVHVLCPGLCHTDFFRHFNPKWYHYVLFSPIAWWYLRSGAQGAQNIIFAATDNVNTTEKNPATGYYVRDLKQSKSKVRFSEEISERLWTESLRLCRLAKTLKK